MATSPSSISIGAAIDKLGRLVLQGASSNYGADANLHVGLLHADCKKGIKGTDDHGGHLIISSSPFMPNNNIQASRFASIAVAATAWAGLSMCPIEALAIAYEGEHRNVGESVSNTPTSVLQLSGYVKLPRDFILMGEFYEEEGDAEMEISVVNVPSIKPPNEGLNSPWVPKINGLKKKDDNRSASMRCPKWTESELEMVLPDFQGRPKPFPRMQGHLYPFWPATAPANNEGDNGNYYQDLIQDKFKQSSDESLFVNKSASSTPNGDARDRHERMTLPSSPPPPPQQLHMPIKKPTSCFTM